MALTDNLISYHKMDESSGNLVDAHSTYDLTTTNATYSATGKINTAIEFSGNGKAVNNSHPAMTDTSGSVSMWINSDTVTAQKVLIASGQAASAGTPYYFLGIDSDGTLILSGNDGTNNVEKASGVNLSTGTYYHVVFTNDGTTNKIYLNGADQGALTLVTGTAGKWFGDIASTDTFALAAVDRNGDYAPWDGEIDEVGIWDRAITQAEVTSLYNSGSGFAYPFSVDVTVSPATLTLSTTATGPTIIIQAPVLSLGSSLGLITPIIDKINRTAYIGERGQKMINKNYPIPADTSLDKDDYHVGRTINLVAEGIDGVKSSVSRKEMVNV